MGQREDDKKRRIRADIEVLRKYKEHVLAFRRFCIEHGYKSAFEDTDFNGLALGFFAAIGVSTEGLDDDEADNDMFHLARICRYDFQYWEGQTLGQWAPEPLYFMKDEAGKVVVEDQDGNVVAGQE